MVKMDEGSPIALPARTGSGGSNGLRPALALALATLLLGLLFTWPMPARFFSAVPYSVFPIEGFERAPLPPGDYLQTYYWFWDFSDTLFGSSPWLTNIYEFNAGDVRMVSGFANFPMSVLWVALLPLGPVGAYNALLLLSLILNSLCAFGLARAYCGDGWAAWPAALALAFSPILFSQVAAGQLMGLVAFLLPLTFLLVERAWTGRRFAPGLAAGACLLILALMEPHLTYFISLAAGVYLPGRFLLCAEGDHLEEARTAGAPWRALACVLAGGLALGFFVAMRLSRGPEAKPFIGLLVEALALWPLAALVLWLTLAALASRLRGLSFAAARQAMGWPFLALITLALYAVQFWLDLPHLGTLLLVIGLGSFVFGMGRAFTRKGDLPTPLAWRSLAAAGLGLGLGLGGAAVHLLRIHATSYIDSIVGKGRGLAEILLFSPRPESLFSMRPGSDERFIFLGFTLLAMALVGCLPLLGRAPRDAGRRVLALLMAFLATVLALGPAPTTLPLYRLLYNYVPFFNYPRVPARFIVFAILFLGALTAWGLSDLRRMLTARSWTRVAKLLPLAAILALAFEYYTGPLGLSLFPPDNRVLTRLAAEPKERGLVLELPLWPGDSHQSSRYEYDVTRTRRPMVNGYSPFVTKQYLTQVFQPLYPMDLGELGPAQGARLVELKVDRVTFHDDAMVYPLKVSPFPPSLALRRLAASGWLEPLERDGNLHLFGVRPQPQSGPPPEEITSPVSAVLYAQNMMMERGQRLFDDQASGHRLLLKENTGPEEGAVYRHGVQGNVVQALAGRDQPGYLVRGPARALPPGSYVARFRLRAEEVGQTGHLGRLEVGPPDQTLASRDLTPGEFPVAGQWVDTSLAFTIESTTALEFRVYFAGQTSLALNLVVVSFADERTGPGVWEAEDLFRLTGEVVTDPLASGGQAVGVRAGFHPHTYMQHGPYQTMDPGPYLARFFLRSPGEARGEPGHALLEVATDMGKRVLGKREVALDQLTQRGYVPMEVAFVVPFRCELDLRVRYLGGRDLLADRVEVIPAPRP